MLLMVVSGGGSFRTLALTPHTTTELDCLEVTCHVTQEETGAFLVEAGNDKG